MTAVYAKCGVGIDTLAGNGEIKATATQIVRLAAHTVIIADVSSGNRAYKLPEDAELGDVVEVYSDDPGEGMQVFPGGSDTIIGTNDAPAVSVYARRVAAGVWGVLLQRKP